MTRLRFLAVSLAFASALWLSNAQAEDDLEVTMTMVGADEPLTEAVVQELRLPEFTPEAAGNVSSGAEAAKGRRDRARAKGERIAERAREGRENQGRRSERQPSSAAGPQPDAPDRANPEPIRPEPAQPESPQRPSPRTGQ